MSSSIRTWEARKKKLWACSINRFLVYLSLRMILSQVRCPKWHLIQQTTCIYHRNCHVSLIKMTIVFEWARPTRTQRYLLQILKSRICQNPRSSLAPQALKILKVRSQKLLRLPSYLKRVKRVIKGLKVTEIVKAQLSSSQSQWHFRTLTRKMNQRS